MPDWPVTFVLHMFYNGLGKQYNINIICYIQTLDIP